MIRLFTRHDIDDLSKKAEEMYVNTPTMFYWVDRWNPSELRIPDPPHFRTEIIGGTVQSRMRAAEDLRLVLNEAQIFPRLRTNPEPSKDTAIRVSPNLGSLASAYARSDLTHYMQTATNGTWVSYLPTEKTRYPIYLRVAKDRVKSLEQLKALPISVEDKILPLSALAQFSFVTEEPHIYRENQKAMVYINGKKNESDKKDIPKAQEQARKIVEDFRKDLEARASAKIEAGQSADAPSIIIAESDKELNGALNQLKWAILISIALIFITMVIQFGDIVHALLVLAAIPFGFLGVLISLFVFQSSLSLNSGLGTILLNGIAVANSIILVDFMKRLFDQGMAPKEAALEAAKARLRPILMTSMTTVLGMFPVALGLGEGGKILQPLGIAVCGGLWVSMLLTLFFVPTLQFAYLSRSKRNPQFQMPQFRFVENPTAAENYSAPKPEVQI